MEHDDDNFSISDEETSQMFLDFQSGYKSPLRTARVVRLSFIRVPVLPLGMSSFPHNSFSCFASRSRTWKYVHMICI